MAHEGDTGSQIDDDHLAMLWDQHREGLAEAARRLLGSEELAARAAEDALAQVRTAQHLPAPGAEVAYLYSVVLNTARAMLRDA